MSIHRLFQKDHFRDLFGAICITAQPVLLNAISVPAMAYIIRGLGAERYGHWATATALITVTTFFTSLGLRGSFIRSVARNPASTPEATAAQLGLRSLLCLIAVAASLIACLALGYPWIVLLCTIIGAIGMVFSMVVTTLSDVLQAYQRLPMVSAVGMISGLLLTGASIVAIWIGCGPIGLSITYLIGPVLSLAALYLIVQRQHFNIRLHWNLRGFGALLLDSRHFAIQQLLVTLSINIESLLLPKLIGPVGFGYYAAGSLLFKRLIMIPDNICTAYYASMTKANARGLRAAAMQIFQCLGVVLLACIPITVALSMLAGPVARILFPKQPAVCIQVISITIWGLPAMGVACVMTYAMNAVGKDALQTRLSAASTVIGLALTVLMILQWGLIGACWSAVVRYGVKVLVIGGPFLRTFLPALRSRPWAVDDVGGQETIGCAAQAAASSPEEP